MKLGLNHLFVILQYNNNSKIVGRGQGVFCANLKVLTWTKLHPTFLGEHIRIVLLDDDFTECHKSSANLYPFLHSC